ncbi:hypothetical protein HPP92_020368 [Vanilla planifolia]|uniref:DUF4378 domain-containing protein n=1 Tax=Vanilla planifolia TaxID=51239 RepID=A0A835PVF4_VANPL|nr:hypothetical protein HPP92_020771 [Vanilla planifolia]KAG0461892.1 hypothetical protein HPP92_020368 [Vanilla planifolia]
MSNEVDLVRSAQNNFVKKALYTLGSQVTNKIWWSCGRRLGETPMKMLIAQEMTTAMESKEARTNLVAKLMGLETLPVQQKVLTYKRDSQEKYGRSNLDFWQQEEGDQMYQRSELSINKRCKDVPIVDLNVSTKGQIKNQNPRNGEHKEKPMRKRMALVHQKFIEAKRLATNQRLLHSKEFKSALEVLSSNRDLFLKLLEEPNSMLSLQLKELEQTVSLGSQPKCITVLKPATLIDSDNEKSVKKEQCRYSEEHRRDIDVEQLTSGFFLPKTEIASQPTRIVVLKPSPVTPHETQTNLASQIYLSVPESRCMSGNLRTDEGMITRQRAEESSKQMQTNSRCTQNEEYATSVLSHGYAADESSFKTFENDYREEGGSECSDSELITPSSQKSCSQQRFGSPASLSSFVCTPGSPDSSVSREAKKRLSERWMLVASNDISNEHRNSSSTLGEMLAIPELKNEFELVNGLAISPCDSFGHNHDMSMMNICSPTSKMPGLSDDFLKSFTMLKSISASECYDNGRLNEATSHTQCRKYIPFKDVPNGKSRKASFKEKISGLFLSRMKKLVREKPELPDNLSSDGKLHVANSSEAKTDHVSKSYRDAFSKENISKTLEENSGRALSPTSSYGPERHGNISINGIRSIEKLWKTDISRENSNQLSRFSTLESPFPEDFETTISHSSQGFMTNHLKAVSRSPHIGSVTRSHQDVMHFENASLNSIKLFKLFSKEDEEQKRLDFIRKLLSFSSLANESSNSVLAKSHSLDSPLDPILLDEFLDRKGEEAKCREKRSNQRLWFDFVNASLKEIGHCALTDAYPWSTTFVMSGKRLKANPTVMDTVCCRVKECFSVERNCISSMAENIKQYLDYFVKREIAGGLSAESTWVEMDELCKDIGEQLLEELFDDAVTGLTGLSLS